LQQGPKTQGILLSILGIVSIGAFVYVLYKGDAGFVTLLALPAISLLSKNWIVLLS